MSGAAKEDASKERGRLIRLIHVGRREIGMDDDAWREYLKRAFTVDSSTQLSLSRLKTALAHLRRCGFGGQANPGEWSFVDTAPAEKAKLLRKILMQVKSPPLSIPAGQQVAFAEGIARQMADLSPLAAVKPLRMCSEADLTKIVQALAIHSKRQEKADASAAA